MGWRFEFHGGSCGGHDPAGSGSSWGVWRMMVQRPSAGVVESRFVSRECGGDAVVASRKVAEEYFFRG